MNEIIPIADVERMAIAIAKSGLFGMKTAEQALALMLVAQAEGYSPAIAARDFHVIQGRPALKADAMLARFQAAGGKVQWDVYTDAEVAATFSHPNGGALKLSWTFEQARRIGLTTKDNWKNYPRAMLRARVISEGIRTIYPGCVAGTYTPEEVSDFSPRVEKNMGDLPVVDIPEAAKEMLKKAPESPMEGFVSDIEGDPAWELEVPGKGVVECWGEEEWKKSILDLAMKLAKSTVLKWDDKVEKLELLQRNNSKSFRRFGLKKSAALIAELKQVLKDNNPNDDTPADIGDTPEEVRSKAKKPTSGSTDLDKSEISFDV